MSQTSPKNGSQSTKLRESLSFGLRIMYTAGFFPMDERRVGSRNYRLHLLYSVCFMSAYVSCLAAQFLHFGMNWKNMNETSAMIPMLMIQLVCLGKFYIFWSKNSRITLLLDKLESDSWNQTHQVPRSLMYTLPVGISLFALMPLVEGSLWLTSLLLRSPKLLHLFPFKTWLPAPESLTVGYFIMLLAEGVVMSMAAIAETVMNTFICGLMAHARAQLVVLRENLQAIGRGSVKNSETGGHLESTKHKMAAIGNGGKTDTENKGRPEIIEGYKNTFKNYYKHLTALFRTLDVEEDQMVIEEEYGEHLLRKISYSELKTDFVKCMEYHFSIVEYVKEIEAVFTWVFFAQFVLSATIICSATIQITRVSTASVEFYFSIIFAVGMFIEMTIFCYFGDNIIEELIQVSQWNMDFRLRHEFLANHRSSSLLPEAIYKCDWLSTDVTFRRSMLIFMETSKVPITVSAGKFFSLSRQTFVNILKSSYSYYAVFKGLMGNEKTGH